MPASWTRVLWGAQQPPWAQTGGHAPARPLCTEAAEEAPSRAARAFSLTQRRQLRGAPPPPTSYVKRYVNKAEALNLEIEAARTIAAVLDLMWSTDVAKLSDWSLVAALHRIARLAQKRKVGHRLREDLRYLRVFDGLMLHFATSPASTLGRAFLCTARLGVLPPPEWLDGFWEASVRGLAVPNVHPKAMANVLLGCRLLHISPPEAWMQGFWQASALQLPTRFERETLSSVFGSCAALKLVPSDDWMARFWLATEAAMPDMRIQEFYALLHACAVRRAAPPPPWVERFWRYSEHVLGDCMPPALRIMLSDCAAAGMVPDDAWLSAFFSACGSQLHTCTVQDLYALLAACDTLGATPPPDFMDAFWLACAAKLPEFKPPYLSGLLASCSRALDLAPPPEFMEAYNHEVAKALPALTTKHLSQLVVSAAVLGLWDAPLLPELFRKLEAAYAPDVAGWGDAAPYHFLNFYSAYLAACAERPGLLPAPRPEVLAAGRAVRRSRLDVQAPAAADMHAEVAACLDALGVKHEGAQWCDRAEVRVDFAVTGGKKGTPPVALVLNMTSRTVLVAQPTGRMRLRLRLLAAPGGWRVGVVNAREWGALQTAEEKQEHLRRLLDAANAV